MDWRELASAALAVLGLACGMPVARWLRWVTYRKPDEEQLPLPGSRWWVVPVLAISWGLLARHALTAGPLTGDGARAVAGDVLVMLTLLVVGLACTCLAAMDMDVHRLPDRVMWPTMGVLTGGLAVAAVVAGEPWPWLRALLAGVACGGFYLLLALLSLARGSLALGLGDVKLGALLGAGLGWFGWASVLTGVYAGFLVGGLFALVLLLLRRVTRGGEFAYGPPMMVGALVGLLVAPESLAVLG